MKVLLPREARFKRTPDGAVWIQSSTTYQFWQRYLDVFDSVEVLARIQDVETVGDGFNRSDGPQVEFRALPYYLGPADFLRKRKQFLTVLAGFIDGPDAMVLRSPGQVSSSSRSLITSDRPYGVEVVGDPADVFGSGAIRHPLRPLLRHWFVRDMKSTVKGARTVSYVTESTLQRRYPANTGAFTTSYSSIDLNVEAFARHGRTFHQHHRQIRGVFVGSLEQLYKGPDVLLEAMAQVNRLGLEISVSFVGGGRNQAAMEAMARNLGLEDHVHFKGQLPSGDAIRAEMDSADIFIMPSRTEGLPRAMIEAMARGLPCVGTRVGGIPELLPAEDMVPANDPEALSEKLLEVSANPQRMAEMSARNLEVAKEYRSDVLQARRIEMYTRLKEATLEWQRSTHS